VGGTTYRPGSLLAIRYDEFLSGERDMAIVFEPDEHSSLDNYAWTRDHLRRVRR
jgi:prolyl oligopeptidase